MQNNIVNISFRFKHLKEVFSLKIRSGSNGYTWERSVIGMSLIMSKYLKPRTDAINVQTECISESTKRLVLPKNFKQKTVKSL